MDYVEWLADTMIRVLLSIRWMQSILPIGTMLKQKGTSGDDDAAECAYLVYQPEEPHNKTAYFVDAPYQVDKITNKLSLTGSKKLPILRSPYRA